MAEGIIIDCGTLIKITDLQGNELDPDNWRRHHLGQGLFLLYELPENKVFMKFHCLKKSEDEMDIGYLKTTAGTWEREDDQFVLRTKNTIYTMSLQHELTELDQLILYANA